MLEKEPTRLLGIEVVVTGACISSVFARSKRSSAGRNGGMSVRLLKEAGSDRIAWKLCASMSPSASGSVASLMGKKTFVVSPKSKSGSRMSSIMPRKPVSELADEAKLSGMLVRDAPRIRSRWWSYTAGETSGSKSCGFIRNFSIFASSPRPNLT